MLVTIGAQRVNDEFINFSDNPGAPGGGHAEHEGPGYQQGGGRGFGLSLIHI